MASWIKYMLFGLLFVGGCIVVAFATTRHASNVTSTQEVQVAIESSEVGTIRESATNVLDKEALVANLILEVVNTHKEKGKDIRIDYVYLDEDGNVTKAEKRIESVQFTVHVLDDKKKVVSSSTQRIALQKKLNN
ncbi:hypothetical protein [Ornithinibacillus contaminans]|uniref:hypothetical protein n=1 Tax=Ornithinibacillus contaminans TaxID=694055 RepID=UPI00064D9C09|nr:hypothetical protein [Ornithinibacillus contaminans]